MPSWIGTASVVIITMHSHGIDPHATTGTLSSIPQLLMYSAFAFLKRLWTACGEPFPTLARDIRHGLFGKRWPAGHRHIPETKMEKPPVPQQTEGTAPRPVVDVAVVIPCHDYANYLPVALESVLRQTVQPKEILVVDDASTDATRDVTESFADRGVRYLRVENHSLGLSRNDGARKTSAAYLLFLDADDWLQDDYIEKCLEKMHVPEIAVVYADRRQFGDNKHYLKTPEFDARALAQGNYIASNALIWRQALDAVGGYRHIEYALEDWDFYRRVFRCGYGAARADTLSHICIHEDSMMGKLKRSPEWNYANEAALTQHPITIFTPFAGRRDVFDRYVEGLRSMDIDPQMIRLHWYDTSGVPAFEELLRSTLATLPFGSTTYTKAPLPPLWGHTPQSLIRHRIEKLDELEYFYQMAVVRAYNVMITTCDTEYVLALEDDMRLETNTLRLLLSSVQRDTAAVIAPYRSGFFPRFEVWIPNGDSVIHFTEKRTGIEEVGGCGFGCTLFRTGMLKQIAPIFTGVHSLPKQWYDQLSYLRLRHYGTILCNWNCEVEHMQTERYKEKLNPAFV